MASQGKTVTLAVPEGAEGPGIVQVTVDGKDWAFVAGRPVEDVPANVVKALDEAGVDYETGKDA